MNTTDPSTSSSTASETELPGWRTLRRTLLVVAGLCTLSAMFYTMENWRGKRAWEKCRQELEAKGEMLDWAAYIPAPVPDDQNIFKAPKMQEWFVKQTFAGAVEQPSSTETPFALSTPPGTDRVLLAEVTVAPSDEPVGSEKPDAVLRFGDTAARQQAEKLLRETLGRSVVGVVNCAFMARPLNQIKPLRLTVQADRTPALKELAEFLPVRPDAHSRGITSSSPGIGCFQVVRSGSNSFRVWLNGPLYEAADYLAWSDALKANFDTVRKGLERPYARMDGDYQQPSAVPIPNFVRVRTVVQILAQRAQCYLVLGQPEAAWHELSLVHDLCRVLHGRSTGKQMTLVAAMIHVAVVGLYTGVVDDGLRLQAWQEPQLAAIQEQLKETDLLPGFVESLRSDRAGVCRTFETTSPSRLLGAGSYFSSSGPTLLEMIKEPRVLLYSLMPRGWIYQNMTTLAGLKQEIFGMVDPANHLVWSHRLDDRNSRIQAVLSRASPYTFLARIALPNYLKASQTLARNQTLANEALIACGLERYRLARGQYPETLEALVPQFASELPHDLIGGKPLKYRRPAAGQFILYSVGWNETDDGGVPGKTVADGDWVWEQEAANR